MARHETGALQAGMLIGGGKFALLRRIGEDGMGDVWEAEDIVIGRRVAIQVLHAWLADNPSVVRRFRHEARAAAMVTHPHIVQVYEIGQQTDGSCYIVREHLSGKTLREHLDERGRLDVASALDILVPIMVALAAMHARDIVHRDIKPENIFLISSESGVLVPKLIDFGISTMDSGSLSLTRPGEVLGTPLYMSPELVLSEEIDGRTDVWAIGAVLFEMLAGRPAFDADTAAAVLRNVVREPVPRLESAAPHLPHALVEIVHRALERNVHRRFASMRDFLRELIAFADRHVPAVASRHAALLATVGSKTGAQDQGMAFDETLFDETLFDETLDVALDPRAESNQLPPVRPIARFEAPWFQQKVFAPDLDQYVDEALQALRTHRLHDAVDLAEQAIVLDGVAAEVRGEMRLVQAIAHRWLGDFTQAERCAAEATQLLARRSSRWYAAVAHRGMANGYLGRSDDVEALAMELLGFDVDGWSPDHVAALCYLTIWLVRGSAHSLAQKALERSLAMIRQRRATDAVEPWVLAASDLVRAEQALHDGDPTTYLRRVERAVGLFAQAGDARSACAQRANLGNAYMQSGAHKLAETLLQEAILVAEPMKLMFVARARASLGLALARQGRLDEALEVERAALADCITRGHRRFEAISRIYLTEILLLRDDLEGAEADARAAIEVASPFPAVEAHARALLAWILLRRGAVREAFEQARKAMDTLEHVDGVGEGDALIRIVYVMTLDATDRPRSAAERLASARQRIHEQMERIHDPELKRCFRENVPAHALTFGYELGRASWRDQRPVALTPPLPWSPPNSITDRILGGDFLLLGPLALGGFGDVHRGRQLSTGRDCAIKIASGDPASPPRVLREARILARLPSDHVPRVLRIGDADHDGLQWFATELIEGQSLDALTRERPLDGPAAVRILLDVCDALDAAHRRGIVHRDVTPVNVVVSRSPEDVGSAYVLGFSLARWPLGAEDPSEEQLVGTPLFMAPEQLLPGGRITPATDVWALGLLAFHLFTGQDYWTGHAPFGVLRQVATSPLVRASERAEQLGCTAELPPWFDDWFARCVSRDIDRRFATAGQAARALAEHHGAMEWTLVLAEHPTFLTDLAVSQLRTLAEDPYLRLLRVERGSIVLVLEGARKGFEKVRALMARGALPRIAGAPALSVEAVDDGRTNARPAGSGPVDAFISYSPADMSFCDELMLHLSMMRRQGLIHEWHERLVAAGSVPDDEVGRWLDRCRLFVTLLSADYIASDRCFRRELDVAMRKHEARTGFVVPIVVRACDWAHPPFSHLSALPRDGTPISSWANRDEGWAQIVRDMRPIVERLHRHPDRCAADAS